MGHLPDIPSEAEVRANGVSIGEMYAKLLAKIEELTLHAIAADRGIQDLKSRRTDLAAAAQTQDTNNAVLRDENRRLKHRVDSLEERLRLLEHR